MGIPVTRDESAKAKGKTESNWPVALVFCTLFICITAIIIVGMLA